MRKKIAWMPMAAKGTIGLCLWALCWGGTVAFAQDTALLPPPQQELPQPPTEAELPEPEPPSQVMQFWEKLESGTIGEGERISYTTISPENSGGFVPEGYYPGELTVEVTGPVVIEAGGALTLGPLSLMGPEASPVLTGAGPIVVQAGGQLCLSSVVLDADGPGPFIIQEPGGSVELVMTQAEPGVVQWSEPMVNNHDRTLEDLWLESGTVLTEELLPSRMKVPLQVEGREEEQEVALSWDMSAYDGQTEGECILPGRFLDEEGQPLASALPLEQRVQWYVPKELVVSRAVWKGDTVPTVQMTVENLPQSADVWGEFSADQGGNWTRWDQEDQFFLVPDVDGGTVCVFQLPDNTPRLFRVMAYDPQEDENWRSREYALAPAESDDSEGNRGGGTAPTAPDRDPEPAQRPSQEAAAQPEALVPQAEPPAAQEPAAPSGAAPAEAQGAAESSALPEDPAPETPPPGEDPPASLPEPAQPPVEETAPAWQPVPSRKSQMLWVTAGAAVCTAVGVAAAKGPMFWKK